MTACKGILIFLTYLILFYAFGVLYNRVTRRKERDLAVTLTAGMFLYAVFFLLAVLAPKYHRVPLNIISIFWGIAGAVCAVLIFVFCWKTALEPLRSAASYIRKNPVNAFLFAVFQIVQLGFVELFGRWSSSNNPANYVAYVTTAVFTDELGTTEPTTGLLRREFVRKMFTETYLDQSAVAAKLFRVHPLIEVRWVIPAVLLLLGNLVVLLIARELFEEKSKQWLFFAGYQAAVACTTGSYLGGSFYYYFRNYEGKTIFPTVLLPIFFYVVWHLYQDCRDRDALLYGIISIAGSFHFTGTTMYLIPVACLGLVPALFSKKNFGRVVLDVLLLILPCVIYAAFYVAFAKGWISLAIR